MWTRAQRVRRHHRNKPVVGRSQFEKDYDRILYSSALRRLAGITQVVRAGEADVFHTRQQHTFKVAQIGRRLAQRCLRQQNDESRALGLSANVVEAACLAHDLGHPPFGHMGEHVLDRLCVDTGDIDGYEGNAQSFRIVTKLAMHKPGVQGIDLTRATLAPCIKYPWLRDHDNPNRSKKWGAYRIDLEDFSFARDYHDHDKKTLEAEIMDWSDDVTYSVHDLDDFHRCGVIPWYVIFSVDGRKKIIDNALKAWHNSPQTAATDLNNAFDAVEGLIKGFRKLVNQPYNGSQEHRVLLRILTSRLISRYITGLTVNVAAVDDDALKTVIIDPAKENEIRILKQITRDYIQANPSLAAQQAGQKRIVEFLFDALRNDSKIRRPPYLPIRLHHLWDMREGSLGRFCCDCISSMTEAEATKMFMRLNGSDGGSVLDPIVR